jgi:hypothetical protein
MLLRYSSSVGLVACWLLEEASIFQMGHQEGAIRELVRVKTDQASAPPLWHVCRNVF